MTANFVTDLKQLAGKTVCLVSSDIVVGIVVVVVEANDEYEGVNCLANCWAHKIQPQMSIIDYLGDRQTERSHGRRLFLIPIDLSIFHKC